MASHEKVSLMINYSVVPYILIVGEKQTSSDIVVICVWSAFGFPIGTTRKEIRPVSHTSSQNFIGGMELTVVNINIK